MLANITIREMLPAKKAGTVKFKTTNNMTFNCNKEELLHGFAAGERYHIDYAESQFQGSNGPVTMKWVNQARFWKPEDGDNTWPDKEEYKGGGSYSGGKSMSKSDYDPELGAKQTAANCACAYLSRQEGMTADEFTLMFPAIADSIHKWLVTKGHVTGMDGDGSAAGTGSNAAKDEDFGF